MRKEFYLGSQNKASPNGKPGLLVLLIRLIPLLGLGILAAILGYNLANMIPAAWRVYLGLVFLGLLLSMVILDTEPGWNIVLFLGFAAVAGMYLYWSGAEYSRWKPWILFSSLVLISLVGGSVLNERFGRAAKVLFPITILYLGGWIFFLFYNIPTALKIIWIWSGLILFTLISIAVLVRGKIKSLEDNPVPIVIELFVVLFNLCWLSGLIWI